MCLQELHVMSGCPGGRQCGQALPQNVDRMCFLQFSQSSGMIEYDRTELRRAPEESSKMLICKARNSREEVDPQCCMINREVDSSSIIIVHNISLFQHIAVASARCDVRTGCWTVRQKRDPNMASYVHNYSVSTKDMCFSGNGTQ
jgi:hypothetical protein